MRQTRRASVAAAALIVFCACAGRALAQARQVKPTEKPQQAAQKADQAAQKPEKPAQKPEEPAQKPGLADMPVAPRSPSGWYTAEEYDNALHAAEILGLPMVLMSQNKKSTCPKHNGQRDIWMTARELTPFIRVMLEANDRNPPELLQKFRQEAAGKMGQFIPRLFLGTASGEFYGVIPYEAPPMQFNATVLTALKSFGGVLPPKTTIELRTKLQQARTFWADGNTNAAMKCYRDVKRLEKTNPKLAIFVELRKDEETINQKGAEEVAAVKELYEQGNQKEARAAVTEVCKRYAGFKPGEDARALRSGGRTRKPRESAPEEPASRTWSDNTGKYKIEAELIEVNEDHVHLKKTDGKEIDVPFRRLSRDDQQYVRQWIAQHREKD